MAKHQNHIDGCRIAGDFQSAFDIFLWDRSPHIFEADLLSLSTQGMTIGLGAEDDKGPFTAWLYPRGERISAEIIDDEVTDEPRIHKPSDIRRELPIKPLA